MSRILGIDFGTKRVGLALSDESGTLARPYTAYDNNSDLIEQLILLVKQEKVETIVVGKPLTMGGKTGDTLKRTEYFTEQLRRALPDTQIEWQDERLSTKEVTFQRIRSGWSKKKRQSRKDAQAAANILQVYLDKK
ncbi:Holliday junction resolvase RuvX [Patescibacteria group bacterium]